MMRKIIFSVLLVIAVSFYLEWFIMPGLAFHEQHIGFYTDKVFFGNHLNYPGGLSEYVAKFIMQFFYYDIAASLIICFFGILAGILVNEITRREFKFNFFYKSVIITTLWLAALHSNYQLHVNVTFVVITSWLFVYLYTLIPRIKYRFLMALPIAGLLYYLSGAIALYIFMGSCIFIELNYQKNGFKILKTTILAGFAYLIPLIAYEYIFLISPKDAFFKIFLLGSFALTHTLWDLYLLYAYLPVIMLFTLIFACIRKKNSEKIKQLYKLPLQITIYAVIVGILAFFLHANYNKKLKDIAEIKVLAYEKQWDEVIKKSLSLNYYHYFINLEYNRAIAHKGALLHDLFKYPQLRGVKSIAPDGFDNIVAMPTITELYYDLAYIEAARRWADEVITYLVNSPRSMEILIKSTLIKGEYPLSEKYIAKYNNNYLLNKKGKKFQQMLEDSAEITKYPEIKQKRNFMPRDSVFTNITSYMLTSLFKKNKNNKMAREYLMANYLMQKDFDNFIAVYNQVKEQYATPPKICEEAIVMQATVTQDTTLLRRYNISKEAFIKFVKFGRILKNTSGEEATKKALHAYADTYWYYYFFNPFVNKQKTESN